MIKIGLRLENPKRFPELLLFIGFVFILIGMGWQNFDGDATLFNYGIIIMTVATVLWIMSKRRRFGF